MSEIGFYKSSHTVFLGTSTCCDLTEGFFNLQKGKVYYTVNNEVSALKLLAFYENLFIGQQVSPLSVLMTVRIKRVEFRENVRAFPRDKAKCLY